MDSDRVDAWVSSVDELLDDGRDDRLVSGDAMRWSPASLETGPPLPVGMWDACVGSTPDRPLGLGVSMRQAAVGMAAYQETMRGIGQQMMDNLLRATAEMTPPVPEPPERRRRALWLRRNRDTGPALPPLGRRVR
jgi:hypothetical protein